MAKQSPINQYLTVYAEPEAAVAANIPVVFHQALVIPAYNEDYCFLQQLAPAFTAASHPCLLILIVNRPEQASADKIAKNNQLINHISQSLQQQWQQQHLTLYQWLKRHYILVVNRNQPDTFIPSQQGVGLARKIGADIACQLYQQQKLLSHWLFSSDADVVLPVDYFNISSHLTDTTAAGVFNFSHEIPTTDFCENDKPPSHYKSGHYKKQLVAQQLYDIKLRYYVAGLNWANSPFAYHTIGSLLAINIPYYCQVRGFPKRAGGEDFYCLNKLAKLGRITCLSQTIRVKARISNRVPFGTGPALNSICQLPEPLTEYCYYQPRCFYWLKLTLYWLSQSLATLLNPQANWQHAFTEYLLSQQLSSADCQSVLKVLEWLGINKLIRHVLKQPPTPQQWQATTTDWFDGFRTLKFIHLCRDNFLPSLPLQQLIDCPIFNELSQWGVAPLPNLQTDPIVGLALILDTLRHSESINFRQGNCENNTR
ncbi:hypothetical protein H0A36_21155 [Endozoicomonas sp. SM1973]|uniref:Glycosyltransferase 2-like domain-containing protein n=1 Tax=Spartinivicinus marinus TaxID=2994442 RepID=A0A853ILB4_9GAMM|nr:hypothetical protein [Spartinivicinus marinus]MCX4027722.1 hypothetical protein [Spartinivicinus marinus]NYZ68526.1 hypothetical protein [Spartinivicinus marinus]